MSQTLGSRCGRYGRLCSPAPNLSRPAAQPARSAAAARCSPPISGSVHPDGRVLLNCPGQRREDSSRSCGSTLILITPRGRRSLGERSGELPADTLCKQTKAAGVVAARGGAAQMVVRRGRLGGSGAVLCGGGRDRAPVTREGDCRCCSRRWVRWRWPSAAECMYLAVPRPSAEARERPGAVWVCQMHARPTALHRTLEY